MDSPPDLVGIDELVDAALRAADELGHDVADVSIPAIARYAGISRSTLLRRLGGSRAALDAAVRQRGVDTGGVPPVRLRAIDAAAVVIAEKGLNATTFDAIAAHADCSVPSLYAIFGTRDELLQATFERFSPLADVEDFLAGDTSDLRGTVRRLYGLVAGALDREPRVAPAMIADAFGRSGSSVARSLVSYTVPRVAGAVGSWLTGEIDAGRIRDQPIPILVQQLLAPMAVHMMLRPVGVELPGALRFPELDATCDAFADNFLRAVGTGSG